MTYEENVSPNFHITASNTNPEDLWVAVDLSTTAPVCEVGVGLVTSTQQEEVWGLSGGVQQLSLQVLNVVTVKVDLWWHQQPLSWQSVESVSND